MGFETPYCITMPNPVYILKQSLWDLKPVGGVEIEIGNDDFEAVPMGFETQGVGICNCR